MLTHSHSISVIPVISNYLNVILLLETKVAYTA